MTRDKNMTKSSEAPRLFVDEGLLKELVRSAVQNLLEEEVARHLGAGPYERAEGRRDYRNGTKPRTMRTVVGQLDLEVPQVREGGFRTPLFERWQRSERAQCLRVAEEVAAKWEKRAAAMASALREGVEATLTVLGLPGHLARRLNTTNMMERTMKEIKQRTRKVGSFPNEASCKRLVGAVLLEMQDRWDEEKARYVKID